MNEQQVFEAVFKATGVSDFQKAISGAQESVSKFEEGSKKIRDAGSTLTKRVTAPLVALGGIAMAVGSQYETSMSSVQAISGATAGEMETLESVAREMGATTRYSASEAADALGYMALAGWETEQMTAALPSVLNLATAGQLDLATASDIVTDMMSMFGIEAENASQASDVFAAAQAKSNTNVEQLSEALRMAGPAASSAGNSLEDTSAVLGILANNGIKGSTAGTALNSMFRDLQKSAENGAVAIGDTSVAVYDAEGNMRSMVDIVQDVEKATQGMSDEQRNAALSQIFQQQSLRGVNVLLNEGSDSLVDLQNELINSNGAAQDMADIMDDNMQGSLLAMKSAAEEVAIQFFEMAEGPIRAIIDGITDLIRWFGELDPTIQQVIGIVGVLVASIGPLLMLIGQIGLGVSALGTFFVGTAGSVSMFATILGALTSPVTLIIAGIAALVAVMVYLYNMNETVREAINTAWQFIKDLIMQAVTVISDYVQSVIGGLVTWWQENNQMILEAAQNVWGAIQVVIEVAMNIISSIMQTVWPMIMAVVKFAWDGIKNIIDGVTKVITGIIQAFSALFTGNWSALWDAVKQIVSGAVQAIWGFIQLWIVGKIIGAVKVFAGMMKSLFSSAWAVVKNIFSSSLSWIGGNVSSGLGAVKGVFTTILNALKGIVTGAFSGVRAAFSSGMSNALSTVTNFFGSFKSAGANIVGNIAKGITGAIGKVTGAVKGVLKAARNLLPFSPPKDKSSPMVGLEKNGIVGNIAQGITNNEGEIQKAMNRALDVDMPMVNGRVEHEMNSTLSTQPAYINVNIGGQNFRGFVENISNEQGKITDLELQF